MQLLYLTNNFIGYHLIKHAIQYDFLPRLCVVPSEYSDQTYAFQDHNTGGDSGTVCYWSGVLQWVEWLLIQTGQNRGEELIMICERYKS